MDLSLHRPLPSGMGRVTQWFGDHPDWYASFDMAGHNGIDYSVPVGTPVLAAHEGIVSVGTDPQGFGLFVRVINGYRSTIYAHLSRAIAQDKTRVQAGEQIALSGDSGNSTGPHLHFGLKFHHGRNPAYRDWVDPTPFRE